nr:myosin heavy chain-related protein [Tanacetum cinerariifolium]
MLRAMPTTLGGAFSLARITEARFEAIAHKEKATTEKEKSIKETTDTITSLQSEEASPEAKGSLDANEEVKKAHTRVHGLEEQVDKRPMELQLKNNFREALETTSNDLEKKMLDLNPMLHDLQRVLDQKKKHYETMRALKINDEEFNKAKFEVITNIRKLAKVYGAWLPPWFVARLVVYQPYVKNHWKEFMFIQGRTWDPGIKIFVFKTPP